MHYGFKELTDLLVEFRDRRDWRQFHQPKDLAIGIMVEAGELLEHFLWKSPKEVDGIVQDPVKKGEVSDEIADVVIYALLFAERTGIDLPQAILEKVEKNDRRYPVEQVKGSSDKAP
jgi:NTP pyrophosphatase (non-canonical NTP hydrolase)